MKSLSKVIVALVVIFNLSFNLVSAKDYSFNIEVNGHGKDIILIPGLSCTGDVWNETVKYYEKDFRCHVLSLPGFGNIEAVDFGDSFSNFICGEIMDYIKNKNLKTPYVIGHSLGGFIALKLEILNPGSFQGLIIVDALPFLPAIMNPMATIENSKPMAENMKNQMMNRKKGTGAQYLRPMMQSMTIDSTKAETILGWSLQSDPKTVALANYELYTTDLRSDLEKAACPILVMGAWVAYKNYGVTHDITLNNYKNQYSKAKNFKVEITDKGKHFIMWDDPEFFFNHSNSLLKRK